MKRFTVPCSFGNSKEPFHVYIGEAAQDWHPIYFQALWLQQQRGGKVPDDVMDSFKKLADIALSNEVSFEDLCVYALGTANSQAGGDQQSSLSKEDEDRISDAAKEEISNGIYLIAKPEELHQVLDDNFYLLRVICRNDQTKVCHAVILVKGHIAPILEKCVVEDKLPLELLYHFGQLECTGEGINVDEQVMLGIRAKYSLV